MRVFDCDCGVVVQAANDDDLARRLREHVDEQHPEAGMDDDTLKRLVSEKAYTATDS